MSRIKQWIYFGSCLSTLLISACTTGTMPLANEEQIINSPEFQEWCIASIALREQNGYVQSRDLISPSMSKAEALEMLDRHSRLLEARGVLYQRRLEGLLTQEDFDYQMDSLVNQSGIPQQAKDKLLAMMPGSAHMHALKETYQIKLEKLYLSFPELVPLGTSKLEELYEKCADLNSSN